MDRWSNLQNKKWGRSSFFSEHVSDEMIGPRLFWYRLWCGERLVCVLGWMYRLLSESGLFRAPWPFPDVPCASSASTLSGIIFLRIFLSSCFNQSSICFPFPFSCPQPCFRCHILLVVLLLLATHSRFPTGRRLPPPSCWRYGTSWTLGRWTHLRCYSTRPWPTPERGPGAAS